jgi:threonine/homoserine/homoserine lactone efflux protein
VAALCIAQAAALLAMLAHARVTRRALPEGFGAELLFPGAVYSLAAAAVSFAPAQGTAWRLVYCAINATLSVCAAVFLAAGVASRARRGVRGGEDGAAHWAQDSSRGGMCGSSQRRDTLP